MNPKLVLAVPVSLATVAGLLFASQGGFGGGHGSFDLAIWMLGLPGTLATTFIPAWPSDFLALVVLPAAFNLAAWFAAVFLFNKRMKARRT